MKRSREETMNPGRWILVLQANGSGRVALLRSIGALALMGVLAGCGSGDASNAQAEAAAPTYKIINVEVSRVVPKPFEVYMRLTGVAKAEDDIQISAEEPGSVVKVYVEKGTRVRAGQRLMQIDDRLLRTMITTAEAESAFAADAYERQKAVWNNKIGTEISYLERKNAAAVTAANLEGLRTRLENTVIRSPIDGVLDARYVDQGEMVAFGTPLCRVLSSQSIKIEMGVPERFAADVHLGGRVLVRFDVLRGREFEGSIDFVGSAVDPGNRTFPIEIDLENPAGLIKPEMVANVHVERHRYDSAIVIPQQAVRYTESGFVGYVAVDTEQGTIAEERLVELGPSYTDSVVVESGIRAGDRLITRGQLQVVDGSHVEVVQDAGGLLP